MHTFSKQHRRSSLVFILALAGCGPGVLGGSADVVDDPPAELSSIPEVPSRALCPASATPGQMHCLARVKTDAAGLIHPDATPSGLTPADLRAAYALPASGGAGETVAIVDAQDDPDAEADLAKYRAQFGLPACTRANGCFKKVNQRGQSTGLPSADTGWAGEIALDLDMVSAACPKCHILLVEADSASMPDLGAAVNTAVRLGASAVSNSYGGGESSQQSGWDSAYFDHPGVAITASAGDDGYGVEFPAASAYVTAVGGTKLARSTGSARGWVESAWGTASGGSGTGSGCSAHTARPGWQKQTACSKRMVADVAAVADPATGVAVYDGYGSGGWAVFGGTSAASPLVAATLVLTGHAADALGYADAHADAFFDVTSGRNGSCSPASYCQARAGYDGPTGHGTPNGARLAQGPSGGSCQACSSAADCDPGEHCLEDAARSGPHWCSADCTTDHASCPSGTSCADLNGVLWGCRADMGTCK